MRRPRPFRFAARRASALAVAAVLGASALAACRDVTVRGEDPATVAFAPSLNVNIGQFTRTPTGLYVQDVVVGGGTQADSGSTLSVYYRGWLTNGRLFDSRVSTSGNPFGFILGVGSVIRGWDEGLKGMRVGGRRRLVIPPALAYGFSTRNTIPAGSALVFEVDLVNVVRPTTPTTTVAPQD